jgi:hypothetical protein
MSERERFEQWWKAQAAHNNHFYKGQAWLAWQSRAELDRRTQREDAMRYRFLRDLNFNNQLGVTDGTMTKTFNGEELDKAVDAEMKRCALLRGEQR